MKTLVFLGIAQLAVLLVLLFKFASHEHAIPAAGADVPPAVSGNSFSVPASTNPATTVDFPEDRLREIVREELAAQLDGIANGAVQAATEPPTDPVEEVDYQVRREMVAQSIQYYSEVGQITDLEMADLQIQIARLRPEDRRQLLGQLGQLLDTGDIDGRL